MVILELLWNIGIAIGYLILAVILIAIGIVLIAFGGIFLLGIVVIVVFVASVVGALVIFL